MRRMLKVAGTVAAMALVASPLMAQGRGNAPMGRGMMMGGPDGMARNPAEVVLEHREALELSAGQVQKLEAIRDRVARENAPRLAQLSQAFGDVDMRDMTVEERREVRDQMRERMRELAPVRDEMRATNRAAGREIHEILTPAQEARVRAIMHEGRRGDRPARGQRPARGPRGGGAGGGAGA